MKLSSRPRRLPLKRRMQETNNHRHPIPGGKRLAGEAIPLAPTLLMNGGLTACPIEHFSAALRVRFLDGRAS